MKPAEFIIEYFGGVRATGRKIGRSFQAVSKWTKPRPSGTDGAIPRKAMERILEIAKKEKLALTPEILMIGGTAKLLAKLKKVAKLKAAA